MGGVARAMKRGIAAGAIVLASLVAAPANAGAASSAAWHLFYQVSCAR